MNWEKTRELWDARHSSPSFSFRNSIFGAGAFSSGTRSCGRKAYLPQLHDRGQGDDPRLLRRFQAVGRIDCRAHLGHGPVVEPLLLFRQVQIDVALDLRRKLLEYALLGAAQHEGSRPLFQHGEDACRVGLRPPLELPVIAQKAGQDEVHDGEVFAQVVLYGRPREGDLEEPPSTGGPRASCRQKIFLIAWASSNMITSNRSCFSLRDVSPDEAVAGDQHVVVVLSRPSAPCPCRRGPRGRDRSARSPAPS